MGPEDVVRMEMTVRGRVQGVGFRWSTQEQARALGLRGWVRNQPDGSVFVVAEGPARDVQSLADWCTRGPARARVDTIDRRVIAATPPLAERFDVRG